MGLFEEQDMEILNEAFQQDDLTLTEACMFE